MWAPAAAASDDVLADLMQPTLLSLYRYVAQQDTIALDPETQKALEELAGEIPCEVLAIAGIMVITYLIANALGWWGTE